MTKDKATRSPPITLASESSALETSGAKRKAARLGLRAIVCLIAVLALLALFLSPAWARAKPIARNPDMLSGRISDGDTREGAINDGFSSPCKGGPQKPMRAALDAKRVPCFLGFNREVTAKVR
jgi:hypothetical protein